LVASFELVGKTTPIATASITEPSMPPVPAAIVWAPMALLSATPSSSPKRNSPKPPRRKIQLSSVLSVRFVSASNSTVPPYSIPLASCLPRRMTWTSVSFEKSRSSESVGSSGRRRRRRRARGTGEAGDRHVERAARLHLGRAARWGVATPRRRRRAAPWSREAAS
jgi:hypothetical protein